jgi:hypothetical protein
MSNTNNNNFSFSVQYPIAVAFIVNVIIAVAAHQIDYISNILMLAAVVEQVYFYFRKRHAFVADITLRGNVESQQQRANSPTTSVVPPPLPTHDEVVDVDG